MQKRKYDYLVFIGRFQPFHNGHKAVIDRALELSDKVIVLIGSSNVARSYRNPFTFEERRAMIFNHYLMSAGGCNRLIIEPLNDMPFNNDLWQIQVQKKVSNALEGNAPGVTLHGLKDFKIGLIGHQKDFTSFYLKMFPQWDSEHVDQTKLINSTDIRYDYFELGFEHLEYNNIPVATEQFLARFYKSESYHQAVNEHRYVAKYKKQWENSPYPPIFTTVDAVVIQSGHVLLVRRRAAPGRNLLALPGGFLNQNERIIDATLRELREETKLRVPIPVLKGSVVAKEVFDDPHRSARGRTITHVTFFRLKDESNLPKVKGGDDADKAMWVPVGNIDPTKMLEDHSHIISKMLNY